MSVIRIPTSLGMGRAFIHHDPRSLNFRATLAPGVKPRTKTWRRGQAYDQGQTPHCVAHTGKGILNSAPYSHYVPYYRRSRYSTLEFYDGAQRNDEWEGEAYGGTSGLGLMRYLHHVGIIHEYRTCLSLEDYLLTLSWIGPIAFGTWWKSTMWNTDSNGFLDVSGSNEGGHEVELFGINMEDGYVEGMNSWGTSWGDRGRFRLTFDALDALRDEQGDGYVVTR